MGGTYVPPHLRNNQGSSSASRSQSSGPRSAAASAGGGGDRATTGDDAWGGGGGGGGGTSAPINSAVSRSGTSSLILSFQAAVEALAAAAADVDAALLTETVGLMIADVVAAVDLEVEVEVGGLPTTLQSQDRGTNASRRSCSVTRMTARASFR